MSRGGRLDNIPRAVPGQPLWTAAQFNALVDALRSALNITGRSVIVDSSGTYIAGERPKVERKKWDGRVMAKTEVGPNQWTYTVREQRKATPGYGGWADKDEKNPRNVECFNRPEDQNSESGVQGTGIDVGNLTGDFAHQPVPVDSIVEVTEVRWTDESGAQVEYWIDRMNGVDGECGPPGLGVEPVPL